LWIANRNLQSISTINNQQSTVSNPQSTIRNGNRQSAMDKPQSAIANRQSAMVVWQLIDSAFPSGSFAHSLGLEAAYQAGEVATEEMLRQFLVDTVRQTGHAMLPLLTATHSSPSRLEELDALCDAFLTNAIANRASRVQGHALAAACARIWPVAELLALETRVRRICGHQAPVCGAILSTLGVPRDDAQRMALFQTCRGVLAAAVRLGIVGPYRAQQLQHECGRDVNEVLSTCAELDERSVSHTAPVLDLLQSAHDRLYSRLFQS
jgi:urease accessory protein